MHRCTVCQEVLLEVVWNISPCSSTQRVVSAAPEESQTVFHHPWNVSVSFTELCQLSWTPGETSGAQVVSPTPKVTADAHIRRENFTLLRPPEINEVKYSSSLSRPITSFLSFSQLYFKAILLHAEPHSSSTLKYCCSDFILSLLYSILKIKLYGTYTR